MIRIEDVTSEVLEKELEFRRTARYRQRLLSARDHLEAGLKEMQQINLDGGSFKTACDQVKYGLSTLNSRIAEEIPREVTL